MMCMYIYIYIYVCVFTFISMVFHVICNRSSNKKKSHLLPSDCSLSVTDGSRTSLMSPPACRKGEKLLALLGFFGQPGLGFFTHRRGFGFLSILFGLVGLAGMACLVGWWVILCCCEPDFSDVLQRSFWKLKAW